MSPAIDGRASTGASTTASPRAARLSTDTDGGLADQPITVDQTFRLRMVATTNPPSPDDLCARALALWPRLDRARLTRTKGDPVRIARLVTSRTSLTLDCILATLTKDQGGSREMTLADVRGLDRFSLNPRSNVIRRTRSTTMEDQIGNLPVTIRLGMSDLQLILTSLRFLLSAEDDAAEIERLKRLIDRLEGRIRPA